MFSKGLIVALDQSRLSLCQLNCTSVKTAAQRQTYYQPQLKIDACAWRLYLYLRYITLAIRDIPANESCHIHSTHCTASPIGPIDLTRLGIETASSWHLVLTDEVVAPETTVVELETTEVEDPVMQVMKKIGCEL